MLGGIKVLYKLIGPTLSPKNASKLNNNYAIYLRSFANEKNHLADSVENELCDFLQKGIPVFAIGDPNEVLSSLGAERLYASDDEWEDMVIELIRHGKMIIVRPSRSNGCLIELNHIEHLNALDKCLFIISSKEEVEILRNNLKLTDYSDLKLLENNYKEGEIIGLKINTNGKFSAFVFEASNNNLINFLILFGIEINNKSKKNQLSLWQHILDRLAFILNPLFYASLFNWGFLNTSIVAILMLWPIIVLIYHLYTSVSLLLMFLLAPLVLIFLLWKTTDISQSKSQFSSAYHYMAKVRFLLIFNIFFVSTFVLALLNNPALYTTILDAIKSAGDISSQMFVLLSMVAGMVIEFISIIIKNIWLLKVFVSWKLLMVLAILVLFFVIWKIRRNNK